MIYRIAVESALDFRYPFIKANEYLDLSINKCLLEEHFEIFDTLIKIEPHNFSTIAHLNVEGCFYLMHIGQLVLNDRSFQNSNVWIEREFRREMEDRLFDIYENKMMSKIKTSISALYARKYLKYCRITRRCYSSLEAGRIFNGLVKLLIQLECKDSEIIVEILKTVFVSYTMKAHFFTGRYQQVYTEYVLALALRAKFDMWGLLDIQNLNDLWLASDCPVLGCLFRGKINEMTVFLKYGFERLHSSNILTPGNFINDNAYCLYIAQAAQSAGLILDIMPFGVRNSATHRELLSLEILFCVCQNSPDASRPNQNVWTDCLSLIWRSIVDPYISSAELYRLLVKHISPNSSKRLSEICLKYENVFKYESRATFGPRRLLHLARCAIRSCLRSNFQLPNGIFKLDLPKRLVAYLNLLH